MRTKHLMMAAVLPALFAACTNEELVDLNQTAPVVGLEGRQLVDGVKLVVNEGESRVAYNGKFNWVAGDAIGACLMDEITDDYYNTGKRWSERFKLVDYIQTNYKFSLVKSGEWCTEAKMCEGNYFFCHPYDANRGARDAYKFDRSSQTMAGTQSSDINKAYAANNGFIGFNKIQRGAAESEALNITMHPVFGSVGLTLHNTGTQTYTIQKVVLKGDNVKPIAIVNPTYCTPSKQYADGEGDEQTDDTFFNVAQYTVDRNDGYKETWEWSAYDATKALLDVITYEEADLDLVLTKGNVVASNKSINVVAMLANEEVDAEGVTLSIYTDKGYIKDIDLTKANTKEDQTTNVLTDRGFTKVGSGEIVKVTFDDTSVDRFTDIEVGTDASDLAMLIHWYAQTKADLTAKLIDNNTVITKAMTDELKKSGNKLTVTTKDNSNKKITVAADAAGALDVFTFDGSVNVVIAGGTQTLTKAIGAGNITVNSGATLNLNNAKNQAISSTITNKGTLNVNTTASIGDITNEGTATVAAGKKAETIVNKGSLTNNGTIAMVENKNWKTVVNKGTIEKLTNEVYGTINNSGTIKKAGNEGLIVIETEDAALLVATGNGEVNNTVQSSFVGGPDMENMISVTLKDVKASEVKDIVKNTNATKLYLSGTLTVDSKIDEKGKVEDIIIDVKTVVATANLTIAGEGMVHFGDNAALQIYDGATVTLGNKTTIALGNPGKRGEVEFVDTNRDNAKTGMLKVPAGATFCTSTSKTEEIVNNVIVAGSWNE